MINQPEFDKIDTSRNVPSDRVPQSDLLIHVMRTKILHNDDGIRENRKKEVQKNCAKYCNEVFGLDVIISRPQISE